MADIRALKPLAIVHSYLRRAAAMLPSDARRECEGLIGSGEAVMADKVAEAELGAWLETLEVVGRREACRGGYWRSLENAAAYLNLRDAERRLHEEYPQALKRLADTAADRQS